MIWIIDGCSWGFVLHVSFMELMNFEVRILILRVVLEEKWVVSHVLSLLMESNETLRKTIDSKRVRVIKWEKIHRIILGKGWARAAPPQIRCNTPSSKRCKIKFWKVAGTNERWPTTDYGWDHKPWLGLWLNTLEIEVISGLRPS